MNGGIPDNASPTRQPALSPTTPPKKRPLSRRRRHVRWAIAVLAAVGLAGTVLGIAVYRTSRPTTYKPGEEHAEITRTLAKGVPADAPQPRFSDVTAKAGLGTFRTFTGVRTSQLPEDMGSGAAWGDYDNDSDDDLFVVAAGGPLGSGPDERAPSHLYENLGNGTFRQRSDFPDTRIHGMGAAWGDANGDGWLDLIVTGYNALLLYRNEHGRFVRDLRFPELDGFWAGAAWGDFDNDRDLDLYVCGYVRYEAKDAGRARAAGRTDQYGAAVPFTLNPASYAPERNLLFRNNGDGAFVEVAKSLGVANVEGRSLSALWHDFDQDGWLDLYVANDISDNVLYMNRQGRFEDRSHAAWVADYRGAMGLAAGDWNRDGDDDLFITHWIAQENALYDSLLKDSKALALAGQGDPTRAAATKIRSTPSRRGALQFVDVANLTGLGQIALPMVGWGTEFADFDADGWLDLVVANGSTFEDEQNPRALKPQSPFLFWNERGRHFFNLAPLNDALRAPRVGRGLALADYDNDGDQDIAFVLLEGGVMLLRNEMQTGHWLEVRLRSRAPRGKKAPGFGDGATVVARIGGVELRRTISSASYLSQSSRVVHFGLGTATRVDALDVRWLGGEPLSYGALEANVAWAISEGSSSPRRMSARLPDREADSEARRAGAASPAEARARLLEFWGKQRAAMQAMKVDADLPRAIALFRDALALNPRHEDSRYYLASSLAMTADVEGALTELEELTRINPQSHRGHKQWGTLRAMSARSASDLVAAEQTLRRALAINPEETGTLLVLGEIALLRGQLGIAEQRLTLACRTNARAVGGLFLLGYLAWKRGDEAGARERLVQARRALGEKWVPTGTTSEGDVRQKMHTDQTPLSRFWERWDGSPMFGSFAALESSLRGR